MLVSDGVIEKLKPEIAKIAGKLKEARRRKRAVLLRFNNDADGITGGICISECLKGMRIRAVLHKSAIYAIKNAMRDISILRFSHDPLLILIDFGANEESLDALEFVKAANIEVIIVDHHPPHERVKEIVDVFLSPWNVGAGSEYTAGFLCAEIGKECGMNEKEADALAGISLTADRSKLHKPSEEEERKALVLDYLATYADFPNTLEFYKSVLKDDVLFLSIYGQAREKLEEIGKSAAAFMRVRKIGPFRIAIVQLDKLTKKHEFPSKGKAIGEVFDMMKEEGPFIAIGQGEKLINFRANEEARGKGFNANKLIGELKKEIRDGIESGGGHEVAASIKVYKGFSEIILNEILKKIEQIKG